MPVFVSAIALDRANLALEVGQSAILTASLTPSDVSNGAVTWRSLAPEVAVVNNNGQVTALTAGKAVVQAISNDGYYVAECSVSVGESQDRPRPGDTVVSGITLDRISLDLRPGDTAQLEAYIIPSTAADKSVRWTTSNPAVADVTASGRIYAFASGSAIITATTAAGGYTATCTVSVSTISVAESSGGASPQVHFIPGHLRLLNLEGYACTLISLSGQRIMEFYAASPDHLQPCNLPPGLCILAAQRDGHRISFKIISR
ncbi:MAG: Ig-like domain-containing protein [Tannerellaceae bacterium]|nr:Ig-like domain-containing protein [Tannerellaceae bacterium]